jgi:hypothetical protein
MSPRLHDQAGFSTAGRDSSACHEDTLHPEFTNRVWRGKGERCPFRVPGIGVRSGCWGRWSRSCRRAHGPTPLSNNRPAWATHFVSAAPRSRVSTASPPAWRNTDRSCRQHAGLSSHRRLGRWPPTKGPIPLRRWRRTSDTGRTGRGGPGKIWTDRAVAAGIDHDRGIGRTVARYIKSSDACVLVSAWDRTPLLVC